MLLPLFAGPVRLTMGSQGWALGDGRVKAIRVLAGGTAVAAALSVCIGCAGFFDLPKTTTTSSSGGTTTSGDYAYVVNQSTDTLTALGIGTNALSTLGTYGLDANLVPTSVAVTIPNTYVYVAGLDVIECFAIGSSGTLTAVSGGGATAIADFQSLAVSPDGQWLLGIDNNPLTPTLYVFGINTTTGVLKLNQALVYSVASNSGTVAERQVRISPNGAFLAVALGAGGDAIFTFNTTTGVATEASVLPLSNGSDNALAFDPTSGYLFVARGASTGTSSGTGIVSFSVAANGGLTQVGSTAASGNTPYSLAVDATGSYLYAANRGDSTISAYAIASGNLTQLSGSPYASGGAVTALARDNSKTYLVAAASGGSPDVTLYSFGETLSGGTLTDTGALNAAATSASGTSTLR